MARGPLSQLERRTLAMGAEALYRDPDVYDQLYRRRSEDVRFYVDAARRFGGPVLELGVGSGRIACALAEAGIDVVGVERMPSMLASAKQRCARLPARARERLQLRRGDLRTARLPRRFPLVIAPFNVLMHMYTQADLARALATCRAHLAPGGRLVLDVLMPDVHALAQDPERLYSVGSFVHPTTRVRYRLRESSHYDAATQVRTVHMVLEPRDPSHAPIVIPLSQRQLFPLELQLALEAAGLRIQVRYGGFERQPFDSLADSQIVVARAS